eukprot:Clim_evm23s247 gene=Clim_evmTU23s247
MATRGAKYWLTRPHLRPAWSKVLRPHVQLSQEVVASPEARKAVLMTGAVSLDSAIKQAFGKQRKYLSDMKGYEQAYGGVTSEQLLGGKDAEEVVESLKPRHPISAVADVAPTGVMTSNALKAGSEVIELHNLRPVLEGIKENFRARNESYGKGNNGQLVRRRRSQPRLGFEGGQTPFNIKIPKHGTIHPAKIFLVNVSLAKIQTYIDMGRLNADEPITMYHLKQSGLVSSVRDGIRLSPMGADKLHSKIDITVTRASEEAIAAVEALGGDVTTRYYGRVGWQYLMHPGKYYGLPTPKPVVNIPSIRTRAYYEDPKNRGYIWKLVTGRLVWEGVNPKAIITKLNAVENYDENGRYIGPDLD